MMQIQQEKSIKNVLEIGKTHHSQQKRGLNTIKYKQKMSREIPPLSDPIIKVIASYPGRCMTEKACGKLLNAKANGCFNSVDIVELVVSKIIDAGRMTDEAVHPSVFLNRVTLNLSNSKISGYVTLIIYLKSDNQIFEYCSGRYLLRAVGYCYNTITSLDVSGCFQVDDDKLKSVVEQCPNLVEINARNCRKLTDTLLFNLINENDAMILSLNIGGNFNITDSGVRSFIEHYRHAGDLQEFVVSGLVVSDETILAITKRCRSLKTLGLGYLDLHESTLQELFTRLVLGWKELIYPGRLPPPLPETYNHPALS
jgi:hypothetical protein